MVLMVRSEGARDGWGREAMRSMGRDSHAGEGSRVELRSGRQISQFRVGQRIDKVRSA